MELAFPYKNIPWENGHSAFYCHQQRVRLQVTFWGITSLLLLSLHPHTSYLPSPSLVTMPVTPACVNSHTSVEAAIEKPWKCCSKGINQFYFFLYIFVQEHISLEAPFPWIAKCIWIMYYWFFVAAWNASLRTRHIPLNFIHFRVIHLM